ncbi:DUF732 domain-containing protein [Mycobacterium sp. IDR2000157661]|uniref:DUF732 domain-containing protein n=1 Tax=Mycobacterium sp. IDR2000157661 TaxID=2867005 RepID=UPI001EEECC4A|nr:DUF732 domain-containing protein [Mycobacterium sp. IDR2000157661]ULE31995.1 DUF732 domain-containing protein [Mycobacterium sp. IDR2000157661]
MTHLLRLIGLIAALVLSVAGAPDAAAAPEDDFCRSMASAGVTDDCPELAILARDACAQLERGVDVTEVAESMDRTTNDEMLSNFIVAGARLYFCPEPQQA